jgi:hypothetical protein
VPCRQASGKRSELAEQKDAPAPEQRALGQNESSRHPWHCPPTHSSPSQSESTWQPLPQEPGWPPAQRSARPHCESLTQAVAEGRQVAALQEPLVHS